MQNVIDAPLTQTVSQQNMDALFSPLIIPVSKLDADHYVAEDIDGVTESLSGSGNLNFLMLQARQTDNALLSSDPFTIAGDSYMPESGWSTGTRFSAAPEAIDNGFSYGGAGHADGEAAGRDIATSENFAAYAGSNPNAAAPGGAPEAGGYANGDFAPAAPVNGVSGIGLNGATGLNGLNGTPGHNGSIGADGAPGSDGDGTSVVEIDLGDVINELGDIINPGDVINELGDIIQQLGDIINLGDVIDPGDITNLITTTVTDITNNVQDVLDDGLTLQLDTLLSRISDLNLNIFSGDKTLNLADQAVDLTPVTGLLDQIIDLGGLNLTDAHSLFSLLHDGNHTHNPGDMDIGLGGDTVLGDIPLLNGVTDVMLDPVEDLIGDVDILADLGFDPFNSDAIDNGAGDTDLTLDLGTGALDGTLLGGGIGVPLDIVEQITGDIDLDLTAATNLLGDTAEGLVDSFAGGSEDAGIIGDLGDQTGGLADDALPDLGEDGPLSNMNIDLLNTDDADDNDLLLGDQNLVSLDPLEQIAGDIDLDVDDGVLNDEIFDIDFVDAALDPVDAALSDMDLGLDSALDLLNGEAGAGLEGMVGDDGDALLAWTENILPGGEAFGDLGDHGLGTMLPEPIGDVAEGLGGLLGGNDLLGGGLFGGHAGGGLFG